MNRPYYYKESLTEIMQNNLKTTDELTDRIITSFINVAKGINLINNDECYRADDEDYIFDIKVKSFNAYISGYLHEFPEPEINTAQALMSAYFDLMTEHQDFIRMDKEW